MAETIPIIQVLAKNNYEEQHLVALPSALPLPPLAPSSLRVKSTIISLTNNTLTYALLGHIPGWNWWDVHPLPPSIPAEFSDRKKYGRISAWGYGTIIESNASDQNGVPIKTGTQVFGYLPIGTLPVDLQIRMDTEVPGQFQEVSKHREHLFPIYNRYQLSSPINNPLGAQEKLSRGYDALFRTLFEVGYMMNRFVFAWNPTELVHPLNSEDGWTFEDAQLGNDDTILVFSPSGKTALSFAYSLKHGRPAAKKPGSVVGIGSEASRAFTEATGLYDRNLVYAQDSEDLGNVLDLKKDTKIVFVDFGARGGAADRWVAGLRESHPNVIQIDVGGEVGPKSNKVATAKFFGRRNVPDGLKKHSINASALRSQAYEAIGAKRYFEEVEADWKAWKASGLVEGLQLVWGETGTMEDVGKGWQKLCKEENLAAEGLVFSLD